MTPSRLREKVVSERIKWIREMLTRLKSLPLENHETFISDPRNVAAAESYLRRGLEALLDLGRHILARGFGDAVVEYKEISHGLLRHQVLSKGSADKLMILAGYRNRMVHFYHEIKNLELYEICSGELDDIEAVLQGVLGWIKDHPDRIDRGL